MNLFPFKNNPLLHLFNFLKVKFHHFSFFEVWMGSVRAVYQMSFLKYKDQWTSIYKIYDMDKDKEIDNWGFM